MKIQDIVNLAIEANIGLVVKDNQLGLRLPEEGISEELKGLIVTNKEQLKTFLQQLEGQIDDKPDTHRPIIKISSSERSKASFAQKGLWYTDHLEGSIQYNQPRLLSISGTFNSQAFEQALYSLIERHEVLRTCFEEIEGDIYQRILPASELVLKQISLQHLYSEAQKREAKRLFDEEAKQPFDLSKDLMIRSSLLKLSEQEHILLLTTHHIAFDGWSMGILSQELNAFYQAYSTGQPCTLMPLSVQYSDYAIWQRQWLQGEVLERQLAYWQTQLSDLPVVHSLPLDKPRPLKQTFIGKNHTQQLSVGFTKKINQMCRNEDVTLFMFLQTAFSLLLSRYSNETDIVMGTPIAGRTQQEIEPLIGFFVNTLVLRTDLSGQPNFSLLLAQSKKNILKAIAHQHLPFYMVVEELRPERSQSHNPLYQITFALQNNEQGALDFDGLKLEPLGNSHETSPFDLGLTATESDQGLEFIWNYNTDLFNEETINQLSSSFNCLLESIVAQPKARLEALSLSTKAQIQQLLFDRNATKADYPADACLHELFEQHAALAPDNIAAVFGHTKLTYDQLNARANQLAHYLKEQGVTLNTLVGLCVERSLDMLVGMLGILKAGGAYIPLDQGLLQERVDYVLADTAMDWVITQESLLFKWSHSSCTAVSLDTASIKDLLGHYPTTNLTSDNKSDPASQLAHVIYTSGSTGQPKGVMISHQNVVGLARGGNTAKINAEDVVAQVSNVAFDAATFEIWGGLCNGACLAYIDKETLLSPVELSAALEELSVSVMLVTTALFNQLAFTQPGCFSKLKSVLFGGEQVNYEAVNRVIATGKPERLIHAYGPTEGSVFCISSELSGSYGADRVISIGGPLANVEVYVLDAQEGLLPAGAVGELHLGGRCVARGYLNKPELTSERFIANPFYDAHQSNRSERLYKTGDLVRWLPDGELEFIGRVDHQVKLRGFRIELGEVEHQLVQCEGVKDALVIMHADDSENADKQLVAFIVPDHKEVNYQTLKEACWSQLEKKLPGYMVPSVCVVLAEFPLTANGKVDRKALPAIQESDIQSTQYMAPRNELEVQLSEIWQEVLKLEKVGIHDNFFKLGGHSLTAMRLLTMMRERLGVELPLKAIFDQATIEKQASLLMKNNGGVVVPAINVVSSQENIPLSFAQQRLWYIDRLEGSTQYNQPRLFSITGAFDAQAFEQALHSLVERHEVLRTCFEEVEDDVYQRILPASALHLKRLSLEHLEPDAQQVEIQRLAAEEAKQPFDLSRDLMIRTGLFKLSDDEQVLLLTTHHIAFDGWSMGILSQELNAFYQAYSTGQPCTLMPLSVQYSDYAIWQRQWLQGEVLERQLGYWQAHLADIPAVHNLPLDKPRPAQQSNAGALDTQTFDLALKEKMTAFCQQQDVTLFMFLQTAFSLLLSRYSNETDIVMGTPIAGRTQQEVEPLIGFFVNTLVLRTDLSGNPEFSALLEQNKQRILDAYEHQHTPFDMLVENLQPERSLSYNPLFQISFALQSNEHGELDFDGLRLQPIESSLNSTLFDLSLMAVEFPQGLELGWNYNTDLFSAATISQLATSFNRLLESIVAEPEACLDMLSLSTETQVQQLLFDHSATEADHCGHDGLHELFEAQVKKTPDALAAVFGKIQLSYEQLNSQANQLAYYLAGLGVSSGTQVGLYIERSSEMLVAMLAILKVGGAYVPLDPEWPQAYIDDVLADAAMDWILTQNTLLTQLTKGGCTVVSLDAVHIKEILSHYPETDPEHGRHSAKQLAYVTYTPGLTAQARGVMVTHQNIVGLTKDTGFVQIGAEDVVAQASNMSFDVATFEIWVALCNGASIVSIDKETLLSPVELSLMLKARSVSMMFVSTALFNQIASTQPECFSGLKNVLFGGDQVNYAAVNRIIEAGKPKHLLHVYGATEASTFSTFCELNGVYDDERMISIGAPLANVEVYVLDAQEKLLPIGAVGELYIGGRGIVLGYLNQPELSSEQFIVNPFYDSQHAYSSERLYRTGDLVRWLPSGELDLIGAMDEQVNIHGAKFNLAQLRQGLKTCQHIDDADILYRVDNEQEQGDLVAYVVHKHSKDAIEQGDLHDAIKGSIRLTLPEYLHPDALVILPQIPLTADFRVDRNALPAPQPADGMQLAEFVPPGNETQAKLCEIWQELLRVEKVGIHDNFFKLGGHSLTATRLLVQVREHFGVELPLKALFEQTTVEKLAALLDEENNSLNIPEIKALPDRNNLPLSFAQQRLWFIEQLEGSSHYNLPSVLSVKGHFDEQAFEHSITSVVERHQVLRTCFESKNGKAVQVVQENVAIKLQYSSLEHLPQSDQQEKIDELIEKEARQPFNLSCDLMLRASVVVLSKEQRILLLTTHHIAFDGVSLSILISEINAFYQAYISNEALSLAPLPIQYADYAVWQREWLQGEVLEEQLGYWKTQLSGIPAVHNLPLDKPRPEKQTFVGQALAVKLNNRLSTAIEEYCHKENVTLFIFLQTAFSVLLGRYSNETDILMGTPIAGRMQKEVEPLIGFFVNTLLLRTDLSANPSFKELLEQNKDNILEAYSHQNIPFDMLVEYLKPARELSYKPLYQIVFAVQNFEQTNYDLTGTTIELVGDDGSKLYPDYELGLHVVEEDEGLLLNWSFNSDLFERQTIEKLNQYFQILLDGILKEHDQKVQVLTLIDHKEQNEMLYRDTFKYTDYPKEQCIHQLFETYAATVPNNIAVIFDDTETTYQELNEQSNQLAHYLIAQGMQPNVLVGLCIERSMDMLVGLLAILKAGGAYVPIDPNYPENRIDYILQDTDLDIVLTDSDLMSDLDFGDLNVFPINGDMRERLLSRYSTENPEHRTHNASQLAHVIYTSGSTGQPKGVMVTHQNVSRLVFGSKEYIGNIADVRGLLAASISFDAATFEVWVPLLTGGSLICFNQEKIDIDELNRTIEQHNVNLAWLTAGLFDVWVESEGAATTCLQTLITGGDVVSGQSVKALYDKHPNIRVVNGYGPTEAVTFTCCHVVERDFNSALPLPIGSPVNNTQVYVLSQGLSLMPEGALGELYIGGDGVASGYLNQPELTSERFIRNPFYDAQQDNSSERLYKTGDLVRWLPSGELEFAGRVDNQVKVRGFRIELGEIEHQLIQCEGVTEAAVIALGDASNKQLVAYIVPNEECEKEQHAALKVACQSELEKHLPSYMVPSVYVVLAVFPLTANGKVDRKALPAIQDSDIQTTEYVAPRNEIEAKLCEVWQEVLKVEKVSIHDNFFNLGGDSIISIKIVAQLKKVGLELRVKDLFEYQSILLLAEQLEKHTPQKTELTEIKPYSLLTESELALLGNEYSAKYDDAYPMSELQQGMLFHTLLESKGDTYHDVFTLHVKQKWHQPKFEQALEFMIKQHPALRSTYHIENGRPLQFVNKNFDLPLTFNDISTLSSNEQNRSITEWVQQERQVHFDWTDKVFKVFISKRSDESFELGLSFHHAVYDGWSHSLFTSQLFIHYQNLLSGKVLPDVQANFAFRDFIAHEIDALSSDEAKNFWLSSLEQAPTQQIPRKNLEHKQKTERVTSTYIAEGFSQHSNQIIELTKELSVPLQSILLAVHSKVLTTVSGFNKALSSTVINTRPESDGGEHALGLFLNSLPISVELNKGTWEELIRDVAALHVKCLEHRVYPSSAIQRDTQRDFSEVIFNYTHFHAYKELSESSDTEFLGSQGFEQTNYDFCVNFSRSADDDAITLLLTYDIDLYDVELIRRIGEYYINAVTSLLSDVHSSHHNVMLLGEKESEQLLLEWNATQASYPVHECLHQRFEQQAKCTPDTVAAVFGETQLSYAELNSRANQLAHYLKKQGVVCDTLVGLCVERSCEMLVAMLGILKAGGAYVPLAPELPQARIDYILSDTAMDLVLTQNTLLTQLPKDACTVVSLDALNIKDELCHYPVSNPEHSAHRSNQLAYVIYTSGSTGQPKGVMVTHQNVMGLAKDKRYIQIGAEDVVAQASNAAFDAVTFEIWGALCNGASIAYIDKETLLSPVELSAALERHSISVMFVTTALFNQIAFTQPECFSGLKSVLFGGEQVNYDAVNRIIEAGKPEHLLHVYGPTEATTFSTSSELSGVYDDERMISIGAPLANVEVFVLNAQQGLLPSAAVGELYIGGRGIARGYLNQPELTSERFIINPFYDAQRGHSSELLYRTGDLVRWLPEGELEFIGRVDHQVKIRGFRIELGEVEHQLVQCDTVKEALVVVHEGDPGSANKQLVAYVVPENTAGEVIDSSAVQVACRSELKKQLPAYMVPSVFVVLAEFPLTANGKIDRKALPEVQDGDIETTEYVAPRNETQAKLCEIWQEVLKVEKVGIHDNFFALGGHSLLVTRLISQIKLVFQIELPIRILFEHPQVSELALAIEQSSRRLHTPAINVLSSRERIPLSFAQQRLWYVDRLEGSTQYNQPRLLSLDGAFDTEAFEQALLALLTRHEVLRTCFEEVDGEVYQRVLPASELTLKILSLEHLDSEAQHVEVKRLATEEARKPFDLSRDLMIRSSLLKLSDEAHVLLLTTHHIAFDGWSMGIFSQELNALYLAYSTGQPSQLEPLPVQYGDYAVWQRQWLQGEVLEHQLDYWLSHLSELPVVHSLPLDKPRPSQQSSAGAVHTQIFDYKLKNRISEFCQQQDVTLFMFLQTTFSLLLCRYSNETDIVMGTPIAGRTQQEVEPLIGFFVNSLVLRTDLSGNPDFTMLLAQNKQRILDAFEYQHIPFEMLVEHLQPERNVSHHPLFQVLFTLQNNEHDALNLSDVASKPLEVQQDTSLVDLELIINELSDGVICNWTFNTALFSQATLQQLSASFQVLIEAILLTPNTHIARLPVLSEMDKQMLLIDANAAEVDYPNEQCIHELFEQQAQMHSDTIALVFEEQELTYQQLNEKANQLAHYLKEHHDIRPDTLVGLCVERSLEMMVGILAIMKAGGAYVPLDLSYPQERLNYMLEDTGLSVVLSQSQVKGVLDDFKGKVVLLDGFGEMKGSHHVFSHYGTENLHSAQTGLTSNHLAYVIYTSGSTGKPKGVLIEHSSVLNMSLYQQSKFLVNNDSKVLLFASVSFDAAVSEWMMALLTGATLYVCNETERTEPAQLEALIMNNKVTHLTLPPAYLHYLEPEKLTSLESLVVAGESFTKDQVLDWLPVCNVFNAYGPTETSVCASIASIEKDKLLSIGSAISNMQCYVLDSAGEVLPKSAVGELYIGGKGLARGYLNQPELTAECFIVNPFYDAQQANNCKRLYKTGDLVRRLPNGDLEFLGRIDHQVKLRGFRIELGEIEHQLLQCEGVKDTLVTVLEYGSESADKQLVAYVVSDKGDEVTEQQELKAACHSQLEKQLPSYMLPSVYVVLTEFPLTPNGKIDRKALPSLQNSDIHKIEYIAPRNETEAKLCEIWQEVLKIEKVGIYNNFFNLGGHSMLAMKLLSKIKKKFAVDIALHKLINESTPAKQAELILSKTEESLACLVNLREGSATGGVYLVPGFGGHGHVFYELSNKLECQLPIYTFNALGLDGESNPHTSAKEASEFYVTELLKQQSQGPYYLIGHSLGASVALEMAKLLQRKNKQVPILFVLDGQSNYSSLANAEEIALGIEAEQTDANLASLQDSAWFKGAEKVMKAQAKWAFEPGTDEVEKIVVLQSEECPFELDKQWAYLSFLPMTYTIVEGSHKTMLESPFVDRIGSLITDQIMRSNK